MSQASAKLAPMPTAGPFSAPTTGFGIVRRRWSMGRYSSRSTRPTSSGVRMPPSPCISVTSAPEQKARPLPVSTTTRTAGSRSACLMASASWARVSAPMAFIFWGRLRRIQAMPASTSASTCCSVSTDIASPPVEHRPPLLEEGPHPLLLVLGREQEVEAPPLPGQAFRQRRLEGLVHRLLGHAECQGRLLRQLAGEPLRDRDRHLIRDHPVDEPQLVGPPGGDRRTPQHHFHGHVLPDRPRPALGAAGARDDPEVDLRLPEAGALAGDDQVAHQGDLAATAQRV